MRRQLRWAMRWATRCELSRAMRRGVAAAAALVMAVWVPAAAAQVIPDQADAAGVDSTSAAITPASGSDLDALAGEQAGPAPAEASAVPGPPLPISTAVSPAAVTVGDPFISILRVMAPAGSRVVFHGLEMGDSVQAVDTVRVLGAAADSGATAAYRLVAWVAAPVRATARVRIVHADGSAHAYAVPLAVPAVRSVLPPGTGVPPRPGRGVVPLPRSRGPWLLALAAAVAAAGLALRLAIRRRAPGAAPAADPRAAALDALARVRAATGEDPGIPHERASRILRRYLAAVDHAWGEEWTSTELLTRVGGGALPPEAVLDLVGILDRADRVKFAGALPDAGTAAAFVADVEAWITATPPPASSRAADRKAA